MKHSYTLTISVLIITLAVSGCAQKQEGKVLARFDGETITDKEFRHKTEALPRELQGLVERKKSEFLGEMINEHYLVKEAERRGIARDQEVQEVIDQAKRKIMVAKLVELEVDKKVSLGSDEAYQYYEAHKEEFRTPPLWRASHILVKTEAEANEIKAKLDAGADFEELARTRSMDSTAIRGGDLGFFQKGQMIPEFETAVFALKKGEISGPVKTQFGYHVIKLTDHAEPALREFANVKTLLERQLLNEKRAKIYSELVTKLKGSAKIQVDDAALEALSVGESAPN